MAIRDDPSDPAGPADPTGPTGAQEVLEAAEAAHLAARRAAPAGGEGWDELAGFGQAASAPADPDAPPGRLRNPASGQVPSPRRSARAPRPAGRRRAPLPLAAAVATGTNETNAAQPVALFIGLLMMAETGPTGLAEPLRVAAAGWLFGHGVPLQTSVGPLGITPLALAALAAWRVARAGVHVTRAMGARHRGSVWQALVAAIAVAIGYGGLGALAALAVGERDWGASVASAGLTLAGFGLAAAGFGSLHATGVLRGWSARLPAALPAGVRAGLVAAAGILAAGAVLVGVSLAVNWRTAGDILAVYETGVAGQAGLTLLCLAYVPNLAAWGAAYLVGPGFAVGAGTLVRSSEVAVVEPLPALPVFAAMPDGPLPTLGAVLLVVPVVAGAFAGRLLARAVTGWAWLVAAVVVTGVVAGGLLGSVAAASGGALGDGSLAGLGPDPVRVAGFAAAAVTVGALLGVVTTILLTHRGSGPGARNHDGRGTSGGGTAPGQ